MTSALVRLKYTEDQLKTMFVYATEHEVDVDGRYDARSAAINVWSLNWSTFQSKQESQLVATFYFHWDDHTLWKIEGADYANSLQELLAELGTLERNALGVIIHGSGQFIPV